MHIIQATVYYFGPKWTAQTNTLNDWQGIFPLSTKDIWLMVKTTWITCAILQQCDITRNLTGSKALTNKY
jgi:hypothetical protein